MKYIFFVILFFTFAFVEFVENVEEEDLEVILLPMEGNNRNATVPLSFVAFGKKIDLLLEKNENFLSSNLEIWKRDESNVLKKIDNFSVESSCHYIHENSFSSAAISLCDSGTLHGFVFLEDDSLEITPLSNEDSNIFNNHRIQVRSASSFGEPHVIKRRRISSYRQPDLFNPKSINILSRRQGSSTYTDDEEKLNEKEATSLTIELAVFFDATAYKLFAPYLSNIESRMLDMILAYVNNIQALYYHPSLGERIDIALVRLELMERQPKELENLDGERGELLNGFCAYAKKLNPSGDEDPRHWDMALYVSGLDFYALENGEKNPITMGLAPVGGVCWESYSCVIAEFGVTNRFGKPYPSAGFTSVYIAAHEIAHNLGMHHDSTGNNCPKDGYIMSPSRGVQGESQWSSCSRALAATLSTAKNCLLDRDRRRETERRLDHRGKYAQLPGRYWTAKRQCELLLRDRDARVDSLEGCCRALRCRTPNRTGFFLAGPALDGTKCDEESECKAGECLPIEDRWELVPSLTTPSASPAGWSDWRDSRCESGCIRGSLGYVERRRTCLGPDEAACPGLEFDVLLCKDAEACERSTTRKRLTAKEYAARRCLEFESKLEGIDGTAGGLQADHESDRPWIACAVFCKRRDIESYYTPRLELNDLGLDPYLPDGTWCHRDEHGQDYFCRRHHCLPKNFRFGKGLPAEHGDGGDDEKTIFGPMNAAPPGDKWQRPVSVNDEVVRYFSLGMDGRPLLTKLEPRIIEDAAPPSDGEPWADPKDYVELPLHSSEFLLRRRRRRRRRRWEN